MKSKKFPLVGWSLVLIGIIHNLFGVIAGWRLLVDATKAGLMGVWDTPPSRGLIFWFLVTGFALIAIGLLAAHLERSGMGFPWSFHSFTSRKDFFLCSAKLSKISGKSCTSCMFVSFPK